MARYDDATFASKLGLAVQQGPAALKKLAADKQVSAPQKRHVMKTLGVQARGGGTATGSGASAALGASMEGTAVSAMKMAGANSHLMKSILGAAKGVTEFAAAMGKAKGPGDKFLTFIKAGSDTLGGLIRAFNPVVDSIEKYRIGLVGAGVKDGPRFLNSLAKQSRGLYRYGIRLEKVVETQVSFRNNLAMLTTTGFPDSSRALTKMSAVNERFGISIDESTTMINRLNIGFNATTKQTTKISRQLLQFAKQTGQPFKKVWSDFNSGIEMFMYNMDPEKALKKFTVFQRIAREMGTDVSRLVTVIDKFDDLETGMEYGGQLNMLLSSLGGSFDAVQATLMSQPERMEYIAKQLHEVGGRIEGMSELGQRAILKQVAQTTDLDIGVIKSILQRDVTGDVGKYMKSSEGLAAMGRKQQMDLAQQQTSRAEREQQQTDLMVNSLTIAWEGTMQQTSQAFTKMLSEKIPKLTQKLSDMGVKTVIDGMAASLRQYNEGTLKSATTFSTKVEQAMTTALAPVGNLTSAITTFGGNVNNLADAIGVAKGAQPAVKSYMSYQDPDQEKKARALEKLFGVR